MAGEEWLLVSQFFVEGKINLNDLIAVIGDFNTFIHKVRDLNGQSMNGKILLNCS